VLIILLKTQVISPKLLVKFRNMSCFYGMCFVSLARYLSYRANVHLGIALVHLLGTNCLMGNMRTSHAKAARTTFVTAYKKYLNLFTRVL
jgi:hypothetical protein